MAIRFDDIGNRLRAFRLGSGLSAEEIARRIGISRTALYRFEKGELAKIETLEKLAEMLGVSDSLVSDYRKRIEAKLQQLSFTCVNEPRQFEKALKRRVRDMITMEREGVAV